MIIMVFYYIEMIIERAIILARFIWLKQDIQSQWGWLASIWALARSRGNWYSKNVLRDFLTWVAILIGLCSSILPAHWINFGQKFAKLSWNWEMLTSDDRAGYWLDWLPGQSVSIFSGSTKPAKLKQRSVEIETDCSQLHIPGVTWLRTRSVTLWRYDSCAVVSSNLLWYFRMMLSVNLL